MSCRYGKLKHPRGRRVCKKRHSKARRSRRSSRRGKQAAGYGLLVLGLAGAGAVLYFTQNQTTVQPTP